MQIKNSIAILFSLCTILVQGQTFSTSHYTIDDGLVQSQIRSVGQDKNGYLWFGSYTSGASKFDGLIFETRTIDNGLCANTVHEMLVDRDQNLWFGTYGEGICKYDGTNYTHYGEDEGFNGTKVYSMLEDSKGRIFFGTDSGLVVLNQGTFTNLHEKFDNYKLDLVRAIAEGPNGEIYLGGTRKGIAIYKDDVISYMNLEGIKMSVFSLLVDQNSVLWIGTRNGVYTQPLLLNSAANSIRHISENHPTQGKITRCFYEGEDGTIWIGTVAGLFQYQQDELKEVSLNGQGAPINAQQFFKDQEGNVWIATQQGVFMLKHELFTNFTENDGLSHNYIFALQKYNEMMMLGGYQGGVHVLNGSNIQSFELNDQLKSDRVFSFEVDASTNTLFIGTSKGINSYVDGRLENRAIHESLDGQKIYDMFIDSKGQLWAATADNGLTVFISKDSSYRFSLKTKLSNNRVFSVTEDQDGFIWATTNGGVNRIDLQGNIKVFTEDDGLSDNRCMDVVVDHKNNIWISHNTGISYYDGKRFKTFTTKDGLSSSSIFLLALDKAGNLWSGNNKTLDRIDLNVFYSSGKFKVKTFDKDDGYFGLESNQKAAFVEGKSVWFGTINGVTRFNAEVEQKNPHAPKMILTGLNLFFDKPVKFKKDHELDYKRNHLTFNFTALSFYSPSKVQYSYILEGADENWTPPSNKTSATFANLPPGEYTFKVKASNEDGVWCKPVTYSFTIVPPFWQTTWFYVLCVLSLIVSVLLFIRYRTKKLNRDKIFLEQEVQRRTRELNDANVTIKQKNRDITDSINYAKRIQSAMLPDDNSIRDSLNSYFYLYKPKDIVSGDFYWFYDFGEVAVCAVGDCTGHGVPGALMSVICVTQINKHVKSDSVRAPEEALNKINNGIVEILKQQNANIESHDGMDIAMVAFNKTTKVLNYAGAYRPLIVIREGKLLEFAPNRFSLGGEIIGEDKYQGHEIQLQKDDCVYMYSDGYPDQFGGERGKKFKSKKFKDLLISVSTLPLGQQKEVLEETFVTWMKDHEQVDDILVFGFKV